MKRKPKRVPRGKSIVADLTDEQLDELAQITTADIMRADRDWRQKAARAFRNILAATPVEDTDLA